MFRLRSLFPLPLSPPTCLSSPPPRLASPLVYTLQFFLYFLNILPSFLSLTFLTSACCLLTFFPSFFFVFLSFLFCFPGSAFWMILISLSSFLWHRRKYFTASQTKDRDLCIDRNRNAPFSPFYSLFFSPTFCYLTILPFLPSLPPPPPLSTPLFPSKSTSKRGRQILF